jgi:hypothetical protein
VAVLADAPGLRKGRAEKEAASGHVVGSSDGRPARAETVVDYFHTNLAVRVAETDFDAAVSVLNGIGD